MDGFRDGYGNSLFGPCHRRNRRRSASDFVPDFVTVGEKAKTSHHLLAIHVMVISKELYPVLLSVAFWETNTLATTAFRQSGPKSGLTIPTSVVK